MPLYVFLCRDCNKKFEHTLHISELGKTPVKCPHCGSEKTEQQAAAFAGTRPMYASLGTGPSYIERLIQQVQRLTSCFQRLAI